MAFTEQVKHEVKRRAAFQCCRCRETGVEIHHILPQAEGGEDTAENAAPLCPNCHTWFGDNPAKRKEIRQMRDWWYEVCDEKYGAADRERNEKLDELISELRASKDSDARRQAVLDEINRAIRDLTQGSQVTRSDSMADVTAKVSTAVTATRLGENVFANVQCRNCGTRIGLLVGSNTCPTCGSPI